jgi:hypothetical protein
LQYSQKLISKKPFGLTYSSYSWAGHNNSFNPTGMSMALIVNLSVPQLFSGGLIRALDASAYTTPELK